MMSEAPQYARFAIISHVVHLVNRCGGRAAGCMVFAYRKGRARLPAVVRTDGAGLRRVSSAFRCMQRTLSHVRLHAQVQGPGCACACSAGLPMLARTGGGLWQGLV